MINTLHDYFEDKQVKLVLLFGSFAKGMQSFNSDVDIAVLSSSEFDFESTRAELIQLLGREVDLIDLNSVNVVLKKQIVDSGVLVIGSKKDKTSFCYNVIVNYEQYRDDSRIVREAIKKNGFVRG